MTKIIGISGTNGAGKDTVGQLLESRHNYMFISVTAILRRGLEELGLPINREQLRQLSAEWRRQEGLGVLVNRAMDIFNSSDHNYAGIAMASMRNPGEAEEIHRLGGQMLWVDADPRLRYNRIQKNMAARRRESEDMVSYAKFLSDEQAEMYYPSDGDRANLSMADVKTVCDIFLVNDDESLDALDAKLVQALEL